jgi:succinyl-diaminopimelate desuccinylase
MSNVPETDPLPILEALIKCPTVTPDSSSAIDYLEGLLAANGFTCTRLKFSAANTYDVDNLFARFGKGPPHLCFAGHVDVVPPGPEDKWTHPPFAAEQAGGFIYGRGAADMKGSVAAFVAAAIASVKEGGLPGSLSLMITGDEEGAAINGTAKILAWMKETGNVPDHCIVGEPTSEKKLGDTVKIGRRGSLSFDVAITGTQGHVAYPKKADNPIPKLARLIDRLARLKFDKGNEHFGPTTLAFTTVDVGNPAANVIPGRASAKFNIRFNTEQTVDSLVERVREVCSAVERERGGTFELTTHLSAEAFVTEPGPFLGVILDAIEEETGTIAKLSTSGGTSDARFIKNYCPVLEFGPLNQTIHKVDERISIDDLRGLARVYFDIIESYARRPSI